jgi:hypothetical protein
MIEIEREDHNRASRHSAKLGKACRGRIPVVDRQAGHCSIERVVV